MIMVHLEGARNDLNRILMYPEVAMIMYEHSNEVDLHRAIGLHLMFDSQT